jgi:carbon-monoxide dehydrogenase medium subunit
MEVKEAVTPTTLEELARVLGRTTSHSSLIAGGTDLIIKMRESLAYCDLLIDLTAIEELQRITSDNESIYIGAAVTFSEIIDNTLLREQANSLVTAAASMGSVQVRNRGTIGGNIANSAPSADSIPPLLIRDAVLRIINSKAEVYEKPLLEVVTGPETNSLSHEEAIIGIRLPFKHPRGTARWKSSFVKVGAKSSVTIAKINIALGFYYEEESKDISAARVALGAVGKTARRFPSVEGLIEGCTYTGELEQAFTEQLSQEVENAIRMRTSMPYKREAVKGLATDVFRSCIAS